MTKTKNEGEYEASKEELVCHECGKQLADGDELACYQAGDKTLYKCRACHEADASLKNFQPCEVYSRIVGYIRPVEQWNEGKATEYCDRKTFALKSTA